MKHEFIRLFLAGVCLSACITVYAQENTSKAESGKAIIDSLKNNGVLLNDNHKNPEINLTIDQAVRFLQQRTRLQNWVDVHDPFREALNQLIFEASHQRYDSAKLFLKQYPYDSLNIPWDKFYIWEPLKLKIPVLYPPQADKPVAGLKDTTIFVVVDTLKEVTSSFKGFPFKFFNYPYQSDSIKVAVGILTRYLEERDSVIINFTGVGRSIVPVWMNSKTGAMVRFWLKNEFSDSVTVWIGNPARNTIGLYLEKSVNFRRPVRQGNYSQARINVEPIDNSKLHKVQKINTKSDFWRYRSESAFALSQTALTNWVKGGENSITSLIDITGYGDYKNPELKLSSNNYIRLKMGFLKTGSEDIRKNVDLLETNSKLNHKAFGKFDFSAIMLFKTQLAPGRNYTKDGNNAETSTLVSKFMSPAVLIIGLGLDYKPNKTTSINFSPLSYKGTFVLDTIHIDPKTYGIPKGRKSLNEPGASFMITNDFRPVKNILITNRLQLFTNYIKNPQNIDVDWEMISQFSLNWFTDIRFNTHLIFDDDTKTTELDKDKHPVLNPDGTPKLTARTQFKEMLGLSLVFRF